MSEVSRQCWKVLHTVGRLLEVSKGFFHSFGRFCTVLDISESISGGSALYQKVLGHFRWLCAVPKSSALFRKALRSVEGFRTISEDSAKCRRVSRSSERFCVDSSVGSFFAVSFVKF